MTRTRSLIPAALGLASSLLAAPAVAQAASPNPIAARQAAFGFNLLHVLDAGKSRENTFISPLSIGQAMTMLYDGAGSGDTRNELAKALQLHGLTAEQIDSGSADQRTQILGADPKVQLDIANALWADRTVQFDPAYQARCQKHFAASAASLDFKNPGAADTINGWVRDHTRGKITSIVTPDVLQYAGAVLTDAVYFHGNWSKQFDPAQTRQEPFTLADGSQKTMPLMRQQGSFALYQNDRFQVVKLPYGSGALNMVVVLPRFGVSLDSVAGDLTSESWAALLDEMSPTAVRIVLPRFHVEYSQGLVPALRKLGVETAFTHNADFSKMSSTPMFVGDVVHKTTLDVDEKGTTATAATGIVMMPMATMIQPEPVIVRVDHPFLCAIEDDSNQSLLFVGCIRDPK